MYLRLKSADQLGGHHLKKCVCTLIFCSYFLKKSMLGAAMKYLIVLMLLCSSCSTDLFFLNKNLSKLLYLPSGRSKQHSDVALCIYLFVLICYTLAFVPLLTWLERAMSGLPLPPEDLAYWQLKWKMSLALFSDNLLEVCAETSGFFLLELKKKYIQSMQ